MVAIWAFLRDGNDLEFLIADGYDIANSLAHQKPRHRGYEGNRSGLRIRFVLSHDAVRLHASIVTTEGHSAAKGNNVD
jgi:hypothetical protein